MGSRSDNGASGRFAFDTLTGMKTLAILALGEVLWDVFADGERFGGAPANFACHAAILGADVTIVSAVGDDRRGREALTILRGFGIDTSRTQVVPESPTGTVTVVVNDVGKPSYTIHEGVAWDRIAWNDALEEKVNRANAVCFGTLGQRSEISRNTIRKCIEIARDAGIPRLVDINLRPPFADAACIRESIALASILKLSDEELDEVCAAYGIDNREPVEARLRQLRESQNLNRIVMTCGANGAVLVTQNEVVHQPGIAVAVVDTVGAGDSFAASFLLGVLRGMPHEINLRNACEIAATVCTHAGAVP